MPWRMVANKPIPGEVRPLLGIVRFRKPAVADLGRRLTSALSLTLGRHWSRCPTQKSISRCVKKIGGIRIIY
jgi:hypothetical protein